MKKTKQLGYFSFDVLLIIFSLISFFPNLSVISILFFGINFIFIKRKVRESILFFNIAILTSILFYAYLKPKTEAFNKEINRLGFHPKRERISINHLNYYNNKIIEYKNRNGVLPDELFQIQNGYTNFSDMSYVEEISKNRIFKFADFYYEKTENKKYYLLGIGFDGKPKTDDDLLPEIFIEDTTKTDLIRYKIVYEKNKTYN